MKDEGLPLVPHLGTAGQFSLLKKKIIIIPPPHPPSSNEKQRIINGFFLIGWIQALEAESATQYKAAFGVDPATGANESWIEISYKVATHCQALTV